MVLLWLSTPWALAFLYVGLRMRLPRQLPEISEEEKHPASSQSYVSIIIPARNEAPNIVRCIESISRSEYSDFEIIVVDDRSDDRTAELAREVSTGKADRILVVNGGELPKGWLGKPWACHQGASHAKGDVLLFTDADTTHEPDLLIRTVSALKATDSSALTLIGRQITETFWEHLIQPHVFMALGAHLPDLRKPLPPRSWKQSIANGQFILFTRETYESMGGHAAVKAEVVEDLRIGQLLVRDGYRFSIWMAEQSFATRMYRSLGGIVEGWSKNVFLAGKMSLPRGLAVIALPVLVIFGLYFWILPPSLFVLWLAGAIPANIGLWGAGVTGLSVLAWMGVCSRLRVPVRFGWLYPLGALVTLSIFMRSWVRGSRVEWKGRTYTVEIVGGEARGGSDPG